MRVFPHSLRQQNKVFRNQLCVVECLADKVVCIFPLQSRHNNQKPLHCLSYCASSGSEVCGRPGLLTAAKECWILVSFIWIWSVDHKWSIVLNAGLSHSSKCIGALLLEVHWTYASSLKIQNGGPTSAVLQSYTWLAARLGQGNVMVPPVQLPCPVHHPLCAQNYSI